MCNVKRRSITVPFSFFLASFRVLFWFVCFGSASVFPSSGSCFQHKQYKPTLRYQSNTRQQTDGRYWINSGAFSSLKSQTSQELVEIKQELKKNMYIQLKFSDWPELINVMFTACSAAFQVKSHHIILLWCTTTFLNWWCFFFFKSDIYMEMTATQCIFGPSLGDKVVTKTSSPICLKCKTLTGTPALHWTFSLSPVILHGTASNLLWMFIQCVYKAKQHPYS